MLEDLLTSALVASLRAASEAGKAGLRSAAMPTEGDLLGVTLEALGRAFEQCPEVSCRAFVGTDSEAPKKLPEGVQVWRPDDAAAQATAARNDTGEDAPSVVLYISSAEAAGAGGLSFFTELTGSDILRALLTEYDEEHLPVLFTCAAPSAPRAVREVLDEATADVIAEYAEEALKGRHLEALPRLGLVPDRWYSDPAKAKPRASWAKQFERLGGQKKINKLTEAAKTLKGLEGERREAYGGWLASHSKVDAASAEEALGAALSLASACRREAQGGEVQIDEFSGLTKSLLDDLLKGDKVVPTSLELPPKEPGDPPVEPRDDDPKLGESKVLQRESLGGVAALSFESAREGGLLFMEGSDSGRALSPMGGRLCAEVSGLDPMGQVVELTVLEDRGWTSAATTEVLESQVLGLGLVEGGSRVVISGTAEVGDLFQDQSKRDAELNSSSKRPLEILEGLEIAGQEVAQYRAARRAVVHAAASLVITDVVEEGEEGEPDPLLLGLVALLRMPLTVASRIRPEIEACLAAYGALTAALQAQETIDQIKAAEDGHFHVGLLGMDTVLGYDATRGSLTVARLLPLHPIALTSWLLRLDHADPDVRPEVLLTVQDTGGQHHLYPTANPLLYSSKQELTPSVAGLERACELLIEGLWATLSLGSPGHLGAVSIGLHDLSTAREAAACIDSLHAESLALLSGGGRVEVSSLRLHVVLTSKQNRALDEDEVLAALCAEAREAVEAGASGDLTIDLSTGEDPESSPLHARLTLRPSHRSVNTQARLNLSSRATFHPNAATGQIQRIERAGERGAQSWRELSTSYGLATDCDLFHTEESADLPMSALVTVMGSRGAWPLPFADGDDIPEKSQGVVAHELHGEDVLVAVVQPELLTGLGAAAVDQAGLAEHSKEPAHDMRALQRMALRLGGDAAKAPLHLLHGREGYHKKLIEHLSRSRAFADDRRDPATLMLSLDGPHGRTLARALVRCYGDGSRTDMLRLRASLGQDGALVGLEEVELIELKGGAQANSAHSPQGRASLALQARCMSARLADVQGPNPEEAHHQVLEALRALCWLGAGMRGQANTWKAVLEDLDARLQQGEPIPMRPVLWACPVEPGEEEEDKDQVQAVDPGSGAPSEDLDPVALRWKLLPPPLDDPRGLPPEGQPHSPAGGPGEQGPTEADGGEPAAEPEGQAVAGAAGIAGSGEGAASPSATASAGPLRTPVARPRFVLNASDQKKQPVVWDPYAPESRLTNPHLVICGGSGAGKTQALKALIASLADQGVALLVLDYKDDYVDASFLERIGGVMHDALDGLPVNPLALTPDHLDGRVKPNIQSHALAGVFQQVFKLGEQQTAHLHSALKQTYVQADIPYKVHKPEEGQEEPSFAALLPHLQDEGDITLTNKLMPLFDLGFFDTGTDSLDDLMGRVSILRLSQLPSEGVKRALGSIILRSAYNALLRAGHIQGLRLVIVIDEAHRVANLDPTIALMREARAYGAGVILSSQQPGDFDEKVISNAGSHLMLQLTDTKAAKAAAKVMAAQSSGVSKTADMIRQLPTFTGLFRNNHYPHSTKVRITPHFEREQT